MLKSKTYLNILIYFDVSFSLSSHKSYLVYEDLHTTILFHHDNKKVFLHYFKRKSISYTKQQGQENYLPSII